MSLIPLGRVVVLTCFALTSACSSENAPEGGATSTGGNTGKADETLCTTDAECDDGVFCNGIERCQPEGAKTNAFGCAVAASEPCPTGKDCVEKRKECVDTCQGEADADGDGYESEACGGQDCDDNDANRFPGNTELCDSEGHDEDCDAQTLGQDADGDGYVDAACCNTQPTGALLCGKDCDDELAGVSPGTPESCNDIDDDCDGDIDEGLNTNFYQDLDGDLFGSGEAAAQSGCIAPEGYVANKGDCDDSNGKVHPSATEFCDGIDSDCSSGGGADLSEDEDNDGYAPAGAPCVPLNAGVDCNDGDSRAFPGQEAIFSEPMCPEGRKACRCTLTEACGDLLNQSVDTPSTLCILDAEECGEESVSCQTYDWVKGDFDFNCDGEGVKPLVSDCSAEDAQSCNDASGYTAGSGCAGDGCGQLGTFRGCGPSISQIGDPCMISISIGNGGEGTEAIRCN